MLKEVKKKPLKQARSKKIQASESSENSYPTSFNTKGYFTSDEPYNQQYLKIKQEVFKKYRNKDTQLVFIDPKLMKPAVFIQRGMLKPNNHIYNQPGINIEKSQKVLNNFLKNYISRKEKRELQEEQRYFGNRRQSLGVSNVETSSVASYTSQKNRTSRSVCSRVQTARSVCSSANKEN